MKVIKDIANLVVENLKKNNDKEYWSIYDLFEEMNLIRSERKYTGAIIELLNFYKAITFNKEMNCWRNNYYGINII
uniref:Uncharacterized protein n=1 Tax=viral metagenome TaxID=1070528 RepID=A0A6M3LD84_9ZZZZ